ncbi:MAG: hypothetical protein ACI30O_05890 [Muribaculaceae bacterium]
MTTPKYIRNAIALMVLMLTASLSAQAQTIIRKDSIASQRRAIAESELVIARGDTTSIILPEHNFGRFDRGLFNYLFIPKGSWSLGLTASYGELNTEDMQMLDIINDFDFSGKLYSINLSAGYFFRHNQSIGLKVNYTRGVADLDRLAVDFSDDINFTIKDVSYYQESYAIGAVYRNYVGLGRQKTFSVFNEVDLMFQSGSSRFKRLYNDEPKDTRTITTQASLNFSPGVCVCIQQNIAFNVSFGVFGIKMRKEDQKTNGVEDGSRFTSGANFRFNIFNINFGMLVLI